MIWIDPKGRMGGFLNLVDLAALALLAALLFPLFYFAYSASGLSEIEVSHVEPTRVVVGEHLRIKIRGTGFPQGCRVKLSTVDLGPPVLVTASSLEADIPPDLPPGWYHPIVSGRRRSSAAVFPILAVWKPEIVSVTPEQFGAAEDALLEVTGRRFQVDTQAFLGGVPLPKVEHVGESLLRVKVPPGTILPGSPTLRLVNPSFGEEFTLGRPIAVQGEKSVPLYVVMRLGRVSTRSGLLLQNLASGKEPLSEESGVELVHLLGKEAVSPGRDHREFASPVEVGIGLVGTAAYDGKRFRFTLEDQPLEPGSKVDFRLNGMEFRGEVLAKPVVREPRYTRASK